MSGKIIIWTKNGCPYCEKAKALLESKGVEFEIRNTSTSEKLLNEFTQLAKARGIRTYPVVIAGPYCATGDITQGTNKYIINSIIRYHKDHYKK